MYNKPFNVLKSLLAKTPTKFFILYTFKKNSIKTQKTTKTKKQTHKEKKHINNKLNKNKINGKK
jgi:hypothetical protein